MQFFDKASKVNVIFSLGKNIYFAGLIVSGAGGLLGHFSPIASVLGKPLAAIVGVIVVLLLYATIKKILSEEKSAKKPQVVEVGFTESYLEYEPVQQPDGKIYWGQKGESNMNSSIMYTEVISKEKESAYFLLILAVFHKPLPFRITRIRNDGYGFNGISVKSLGAQTTDNLLLVSDLIEIRITSTNFNELKRLRIQYEPK